MLATTAQRKSPVVIELHPHEDACIICGVEIVPRHGVPMYEGEIVPDEYAGPWAGFHACLRCYLIVRGLQVTFPGRPFPAQHVRRLALQGGRG